MTNALAPAPTSAPVFRCTCDWSEGSQDHPLAVLVANLSGNPHDEIARATVERLQSAKVGESVTWDEPFNGRETFTRIA